MEDIKLRLLAINKIVNGHSPLENEGLDGEVVSLLLRKSLEQLAFASLIAHRAAYEAVNNDTSSMWRAKKLLERLEAVHPEFYPKPVAFPSIDTGKVKHMLDISDDYLTRADFAFLYDTCSDILHTWNPFRSGPRVVNFQRPLAEWVLRIQRLLDVHYIRLAGTDELWLIQMHQPEDGKVHAYTVAPI